MNVRLVQSSNQASTLGEQNERKARMIATLEGLLRDTFRLKSEGALYAKLAHAQGYADGYMKVMVDGGFVDNHELLEIIRNVRRGVDGPSTRAVTTDLDALSA